MKVSHAPGPAAEDGTSESLTERFQRVRSFTTRICETLETEDFVVQSMPDVSPTRWHLAHTTWFFETFILREHLPGYRSIDDRYNFLFNSYYNAVGEQFSRPDRGLLSRPTVAEIRDYRRHVDEHMTKILASADAERLRGLIEVGLQHEQQHQELMLTDIKHVFSVNPLRPSFRQTNRARGAGSEAAAMEWSSYEGGVQRVGHTGEGFSFDNEGPQHRVFLEPFQLSSRLVTNAEYRDFIADGGYARPELWLDAGWKVAQEEGWTAPIYWEDREGEWWQFTMAGMQALADAEPIVHVSYYEADAYARWAGRRLPTEFEWEAVAREHDIEGNFVDDGIVHLVAATALPGAGRLAQLFGDVWEWTQSHYSAYPGYRPAAGAIGEYNGKWMANQFVLRGGSCATSSDHIRRTYRNFFHGAARWQFAGLRLADDTRTS